MAVNPADLIPGGEPPKIYALPDLPMLADGARIDGMKDIRDIRNVRMFMINILGKNFNPNDPKSVAMLQSMLKDADQAAINTLRVQIEDKSTDAAAAAQALAAAVLKLVTDPANSVLPSEMRGDVVDVQARNVDPPELPDDIVTRDFVPGEAQQGTVHQTYDQFKDRVGGVTLAEKTVVDD